MPAAPIGELIFQDIVDALRSISVANDYYFDGNVEVWQPEFRDAAGELQGPAMRLEYPAIVAVDLLDLPSTPNHIEVESRARMTVQWRDIYAPLQGERHEGLTPIQVIRRAYHDIARAIWVDDSRGGRAYKTEILSTEFLDSQELGEPFGMGIDAQVSVLYKHRHDAPWSQ